LSLTGGSKQVVGTEEITGQVSKP